jgi:fatty acid-binding protein DegV
MIYDHFDRTGQTPTTSAPSVADLIDAFAAYAGRGRDIVFIGISSEMSSTCQNAMLAAREFSDVVIRVVDSRNLSSGVGLLAARAAERSLCGHARPMRSPR